MQEKAFHQYAHCKKKTLLTLPRQMSLYEEFEDITDVVLKEVTPINYRIFITLEHNQKRKVEQSIYQRMADLKNNLFT